MKIDPFTQEVIHEALISVVAEMRVTLLRTSFSSIIYEGQDFSCALADRFGRLVIQSKEDFPAHVGPLNMQVPQAIQKLDGRVYEGDVIVTNDPFTSGTHLNDVAVITPIFVRGKLLMFACSRAHWGDVGGMTPGSVSGQTNEIFQEGVRIPIIKLYEKGRLNTEVHDLLFSNVRQPRDRKGDLLSQLAAARAGTSRVLELVKRFGLNRVRSCLDLILALSELRIRRQIARLPKGVFAYKDYLDSDGQSDREVPICVRLTVNGRSISADFSGTAPQRPGPTNSSLAVTSTAVFVAMKALLDPDGHINEGAFRPFKVNAPAGSLLNATYPAPMGGFVEVLRRIESAIMGAMSRCIPDHVAGDTKGCANHIYISHLAGNTVRSIHYEYPAGGTGGFLGGDGSNTVREWDTGDFSSIHSAEIVEVEHPCVVEECVLRTDSGGAGAWRGGLGLRRVINVLGEQARLSVLSDRNVMPPFGVNGGSFSKANAFLVIRDGKERLPSGLPGKVSGFMLNRNDRVVAMSAGGGGFGDPLDRDIDAVLSDVREGYVSTDAALAEYGVVFRNGTVDRAATEAARIQKRRSRNRLRVLSGPMTSPSDSLEQAALASVSATELRLTIGAIVEVGTDRGAPLRARLVINDRTPQGSIQLSPFATAVLQCTDGDLVSLRGLPQVF